MDSKMTAGIVVVVLIIGGGAFWGGMKYANAKALKARTDRTAQFQGGQTAGRRTFGGGAGGVSRGEIIKKDETSVTIKMPDGSTKIVFYSASTKVGKTVEGTVADLEVGETVLVSGKSGSDGSMTAEVIQQQTAVSPAAIGR